MHLCAAIVPICFSISSHKQTRTLLWSLQTYRPLSPLPLFRPTLNKKRLTLISSYNSPSQRCPCHWYNQNPPTLLIKGLILPLLDFFNLNKLKIITALKVNLSPSRSISVIQSLPLKLSYIRIFIHSSFRIPRLMPFRHHFPCCNLRAILTCNRTGRSTPNLSGKALKIPFHRCYQHPPPSSALGKRRPFQWSNCFTIAPTLSSCRMMDVNFRPSQTNNNTSARKMPVLASAQFVVGCKMALLKHHVARRERDRKDRLCGITFKKPILIQMSPYASSVDISFPAAATSQGTLPTFVSTLNIATRTFTNRAISSSALQNVSSL